MQKYTNHKTEVSPCSQPHCSVELCSDVLSVTFSVLCAVVMGRVFLIHLVHTVIFCLEPTWELMFQCLLPGTPSVRCLICPPASVGWCISPLYRSLWPPLHEWLIWPIKCEQEWWGSLLDRNVKTEYVAHHIFLLCLCYCWSLVRDAWYLCQSGSLSNSHEKSSLVILDGRLA